MGKRWKLGAAAVIAIGVVTAVGYAQFPSVPDTPPMAAAEAAKRSAWDFNLVAIDGAPLPMAKFKGQVVLLVNTASMCGFTPQYEGLQKVQDSYAKRGFTVVGVPSGNFKGQEYGSNGEIAAFCKSKAVKFPLAEKSDVVGPQALPIYRWAAAKLGQQNTPKWNFHKYLIGRDGRLIAAFGTRTAPTDPKVTSAIEDALKTRG
ncbi:glutathione peroxidase [Sphingomonas sp. KC8]|uniref:glutathione peroxidase n=1 Tax=Sphingomonas sp. KC8 TaxID=1030157 RepID=UPI0002488B78|nr:redoxin domain-containing protein [Sphingomonas sp. KC8]ARS27142.1 glutathione peroxidase [Sphingomonas sp. KC8]